MISANSQAASFIDQGNIPKLLKDTSRWVTWKAGERKPTGKFDKVPINPTTGRNVSANEPNNWMSFDDAYAAYQAGKCSGIGIALSADPIGTWGNVLCGAPQYLVALDFDGCANNLKPAKTIKKDMGDIYGEISPSGNGIRMFALSRELTKGGNTGDGRELYSTGRFMTVTGMGGRGKVIDATEKLAALSCNWFPDKVRKPAKLELVGKPPSFPSSVSDLTRSLAGTVLESPEAVSTVQTQLSHVNADCSYEQWRNVVWSILSTGWNCAEELARGWSISGGNCYNEKAFDTLVTSFDPTGGITLGTLIHHAKAGGWRPASAALTPQLPTAQSADPNGEQRHRLISAAELIDRPALQWSIKGLLPAKGLATIYGQSGSGKTFVAMDMACAIASGHPQWFGFKVKSAPVAYVALEGSAGLTQRMKAWQDHHRTTASQHIRFLLGGFTLLEVWHVTKLATEILEVLGSGAIVFVDTLNQSAPGADENSSVDMGIVISNAKALAEAVDGIVVLVHHSGKDQGKGMRGHSSLHAAMDAVIEVVSTANGREWRVAKSKDGEMGYSHGFELVPYLVGQDSDGDEIRSCAVRASLLSTGQSRKAPTGRNQQAALPLLRAAIATCIAGISMADAVQKIAPSISGPDGRKSSRAKEVISRLVASGHLVLDADRLLVA